MALEEKPEEAASRNLRQRRKEKRNARRRNWPDLRGNVLDRPILGWDATDSFTS